MIPRLVDDACAVADAMQAALNLIDVARKTPGIGRTRIGFGPKVQIVDPGLHAALQMTFDSDNGIRELVVHPHSVRAMFRVVARVSAFLDGDAWAVVGLPTVYPDLVVPLLKALSDYREAMWILGVQEQGRCAEQDQAVR